MYSFSSSAGLMPAFFCAEGNTMKKIDTKTSTRNCQRCRHLDSVGCPFAFHDLDMGRHHCGAFLIKRTGDG
jgi:hypothetical protein